MAFMIPKTLKNQPDTTAGERKLFALFRRTLPDKCIVRYEVLLGQRHYKPDYTLMDPDRGILVVEVKDWGVSTIARATSEQFYVRYGGGPPTPQMNPDRKCKVYLRHARENLASMPDLRSDGGKLQVSTAYFVAFPNITHEEFSEHNFNELIPTEHVLLSEDLVSRGKPFLDRYDQRLPSLGSSLTQDQQESVKKALFPDITIPTVFQHGFDSAKKQVVDPTSSVVQAYQLSLEQEQIAKSLGEGPRLLRGIAGTGKTLIMLYRAKMLAANNEDVHILILCWNTSLANYMRQAYEMIEFEMIEADGQVTIRNFSQFARDTVGRPPEASGFERRLNRLTPRTSEKYDAIYVDEAQDFRREWIEFLYHKLLKGAPKERNLLIAADDAQRIYHNRDFRWSDLGIDMRGRSKILRTVYRNSARVWVFSAFLLEEKASYIDGDSDRVRFSSKGGYDPQLIECSSLEAQVEKTIRIVKAMLGDEYAARNVLILYRHKRVNGFHLVDYLRRRLYEEGIPNDWIAEDPRAKRTFDWQSDTVKISTVHSAKGMDSPIVIILGAETFQQEKEQDESEIHLAYVALTRARELLVILHTGNSGVVPKLKRCQAEYEKYRDQITALEGEAGSPRFRVTGGSR